MCFISVIIPAYNVEKYIKRCVDSVLNQNYEKFEIIIINDGSTDSTLNICNENYKNKENIKIINQENRGLSGARNAGINAAIGEYLMFVDGDDFLDNNNCLEKINEVISKRKYDIVQYKMKYFYEKGNKYIDLKSLPNVKKYNNKNEIIEILIEQGCLSVSACDKVIKTEIIKNNKLLFKERIIVRGYTLVFTFI